MASGVGVSMDVVGASCFEMVPTNQHKCAGVLWKMDLDFSAAVLGKICRADALVAFLASLVSSGSLPLAFAVRIFESK